MKIDVGICSFGNLKGLNNTLLSVAPIVDSLIVVNVPFLGFPVPEADPPLRIYEKSQILQRPNITLYQQSEPMTQLECRNKYLELTNAEFMIVMDDDEVIYQYNPTRFHANLLKIKETQKQSPGLFTLWYINQNGVPMSHNRLLYLPNRFRYTGNHWHYEIDGKYYGAHGIREVTGLTLKHLKWDEVGRTKEWEKSFERYEIFQLHNERQVFT